jgi:integrase
MTGKKPEITLTQALGRYWMEHGQHLGTADDIKRMGRALQELPSKGGLGKDTLLSNLTAARLVTYAAERRARVSNRSVNIELEHLRAVMRRAHDLWGVAVANIEWKKVLLEETGEREHILSEGEEERLLAALCADYHAMMLFALVSGVRLANVIELGWSQVDWDEGVIRFRVKSKKPGGELHYLPLTPALATILSRERGRHPVWVFTYVCNRTRHDPKRKLIQHKGERYPFTHDGWRKEWRRALAEAGIADFRFHDLRHTAATRTLRVYRDLRTVQKMLGHKSIATTLRYTRSAIEDVRAAMEAVETATAKPRLVNREAKNRSGSEG